MVVYKLKLSYVAVAPRVGAWIEIPPSGQTHRMGIVAPRVGAWIEISKLHFHCPFKIVAPRVGAWIEIRILQSSIFFC